MDSRPEPADSHGSMCAMLGFGSGAMMGWLDPLRYFVIRRLQRYVNPMRDEADDVLNAVEQSGKQLELTDAEWDTMCARNRRAEEGGLLTERDRARMQRVARLSGRQK